MIRRARLLAALAAAVAVPSPALAGWTAPAAITTRTEDPVAAGAFGGSVWLGGFERAVSVAKRSGDGFGAAERITAVDPFEEVWDAGFAENGDGVVITVRRHRPVRRIRATLVAAGGGRIGPRTISGSGRSAGRPRLSVAADGTAVAAWEWHAAAGWRVQAATRRPGESRFGRPQTLSPPATGRARPWIHVAVGTAGRAVLAWQITGDSSRPESPLHVHTAGPDGLFGAAQEMPDVGGIADVGLAVDPAGEVLVADLHWRVSGRESHLRVMHGPPGAPLSAPAVLSTGGSSLHDGTEVDVAFSADGTATIAWVRPSEGFADGGALEIFTRPPAGTFGGAQTVARQAVGIDLAGGPGASAALTWMERGNRHSVHAVTRSRAGGPFGLDTTLSTGDLEALWPTTAMTPAGDAIAAWITNDSGSGVGLPTAAIHAAD